ncbi:MAG: hypothetical protein KDC61_02370 [Saprospiraceae bacterium]|nr:hypothetical protein [Saprospiraceae bacterium]
MFNLLLPYQQPKFVAGQLLTADNLNAIWQHLESQNRATRISLIGAGIFYGLEIKPGSAANQIIVSKGAGVCSEGHLFFLECDQEDAAQQQIFYFTAAKNVPLKELNPNIGNTSQEAGVLEWTLTPSSNNLPDGTQLDEMCFILFLEITQKGDTSCLASSNPAGVSVEHEVKLLALEKDDLDLIWLTQTASVSGGNGADAQFPYVKRLPVWDLIKDKKTLPDGTMENVTWQELKNAYLALCEAALLGDTDGDKIPDGTLTKAIQKVLNKAYDNHLETLASSFDGTVNEMQRPYLHDYLKDLVAAYEEWALNKPAEPIEYWCPDSKEFPKFIALGKLPPAPNECRMPYYKPGIPGDQNMPSLDPLLERLKFMATVANLDFFSLANPNAVVKITGARRKCPPLSEQAIPFYYKNNAELRPLWNPAMTAAGRTKAIPSYFPHPSPTEKPFDQPLCYDLEQFDFFRIEGHIGKTLKDGLQKIDALRQELNLPFKIVALRIDTAANIIYQSSPNDINSEEILAILNQMQFSVFVKDHPGIEHMGGVPRGGTFILVFQETLEGFDQEEFEFHVRRSNEKKGRFDIDYLSRVLQRRIVADFCLPYGCYEGPNIQYCFTEVAEQDPKSDFEVREISYFWDAKSDASHVKVELENRSQFANQFKWYIDLIKDGDYIRLDANNDGVLNDDDFFDEPHILTLDFNLAEVQKIQVRLHAIKINHPEDTSEQVIELCPAEMSLFVFDPIAKKLAEEVTWELPGDGTIETKIVFTPTGGVLSVDGDGSGLGKLTRTATEATLTVDNTSKPGTYTLHYYFCAGQERQVRITLTEPQGRPGEEIAVLRSAASDTRRIQFIANVENAADKNLSPTIAFKRTLTFLTMPQLTVEDAVRDFESVARLLFNSFGKPGGATDEQYATLLHNATWGLLDKVVSLNPASVPAPLQTALESLVPALQKVNVDVNALRKNWNSKDLKTKDNTKIIKAIEAILKT